MNKKLVLILLLCGINYTQADVGHSSLNAQLIEATKKGNAKLIKSLIRKGANVNTQNENGMSPLMFSILNGHPESVLTLLHTDGINVNVQNKNLSTALMYAAGRADSGPYFETLLFTPNINIDEKDSHGWTALMYAARNNQTNNLRLLLSRGANSSIKNDKGYKAFDIAHRWGKKNAIRALEGFLF